MQETAVFFVIELVSVEDPAGLKTYVQRASELIGPLGGELVAQGAIPINGEPGFAPLVIQRWSSEAAFTGEGRNSSRSQCTRDGHRFESPQLHQGVPANRHDFLVRGIGRYYLERTLDR